jgi:uncharacterized protein (DUF2235 family)
MRRLVFCFDGSWNKLDTKSHPTNVVLLAESVPPITDEGVQQIVYYDEGVGTSSDETFRGGAFGKGLVQNIREAYRFLIFNYVPGDEIFVFGFSRGAFTARSFLGFIRAVGILKVNDANQISEAWRLYQAHAVRADDDPDELLRFRANYCPELCVTESEADWRRANGSGDGSDPSLLRIRYCGVWDTVGTLGWKAVSAVFDRRTDKPYAKHDTELSPSVEAARHALAIDERRAHFLPTLWRNVRDLNERAGASHYDADAPYQQKWFAGDHGSIGGGGPERGLSNAALHWVLRGAIYKGLVVNLTGRSQLKTIRYDAAAPLHNTPAEGLPAKRLAMNSVKVAAGWAKAKLLTTTRSGPMEINDIHPSTLRRWFKAPGQLPEGEAYRPAPLSRLKAEIEKERGTYAAPPDEATFPRYEVQPDDTLSRIARDELGDMDRWREIFALNRDLIDDHRDIFPGDVLRLPVLSGGAPPAA